MSIEEVSDGIREIKSMLIAQNAVAAKQGEMISKILARQGEHHIILESHEKRLNGIDAWAKGAAFAALTAVGTVFWSLIHGHP
jgi:hypothetical protein